MQSISLFLDTVKFADFQSKNADDSKTQGVCHVIHVFFKSSLGNKCAKSHHCRICVTDFRRDLFAHPPPPTSMSCPEKAHPE